MGECAEVAQQAPERREVQRENASETGVHSLSLLLRISARVEFKSVRLNKRGN